MLRILLIILVALAVIIGLMKLTGTRPDAAANSGENQLENAGEAVEEVGAAISESAGDAEAVAEDPIEPVGDVYSDVSEAPLDVTDASGEAASEPVDPAVGAPATAEDVSEPQPN